MILGIGCTTNKIFSRTKGRTQRGLPAIIGAPQGGQDRIGKGHFKSPLSIFELRSSSKSFWDFRVLLVEVHLGQSDPAIYSAKRGTNKSKMTILIVIYQTLQGHLRPLGRAQTWTLGPMCLGFLQPGRTAEEQPGWPSMSLGLEIAGYC